MHTASKRKRAYMGECNLFCQRCRWLLICNVTTSSTSDYDGIHRIATVQSKSIWIANYDSFFSVEKTEQKSAYNILQRFYKDDRFIGGLAKNVLEYFNCNKHASRDYSLRREQMLKYIPNLFEGEAKRYNRDHE